MCWQTYDKHSHNGFSLSNIFICEYVSFIKTINLLPLLCPTFIFACKQEVMMQICNGCFNSHILALSQVYAAICVKMYAFIKAYVLTYMVSHGVAKNAERLRMLCYFYLCIYHAFKKMILIKDHIFDANDAIPARL